MIAGVPAETFPGERRVALVPADVGRLAKRGIQVLVQAGAGAAADQARTVVVIKRSLSPGFAGIANPLFAADNTMMLFGDGRKVAAGLTGALKEYA